MARTLCIANQKGGVGKTTTAINLAAGMGMAGRRTLLIDLDPQCNATTGLGLPPAERHPLVCSQPIGEAVVAAPAAELWLLPGSHCYEDVRDLATAQAPTAERLSDYLLAAHANYEFILIDCPPSLGHLTESALVASHEVLMPIQCEYFAMEGLAQMIEVIRRVMRQPGKRLEFGGILLTMHDAHCGLAEEVEAEVREFFGEIVFDTVIPRDVAVSEAPSFGRPVLDHAPRSRGTRAYLELCMEVLER